MIRVVTAAVLLCGLAGPASADAPRSAQETHDICVAALNADPKLAEQVVAAVNQDTAKQHIDAAEHVAKNERHVIGAYAAMWVIAALFLLFLWRRQQLLRTEIDRLRTDLDRETKGKDALP